MGDISNTLVLDYMELNISEMGKRSTVVDPLYKRIDQNGRVYISKDLVGKEVLILVLEPKPQDKIDYIKVGRSA